MAPRQPRNPDTRNPQSAGPQRPVRAPGLPQWATPGLTPWEQLFGAPTTPQTVWYNPTTKHGVQTDDPMTVAALATSGYSQIEVAPGDWAAFEKSLADQGGTLESPTPGMAFTPPPATQRPMTPQEIEAINTGIGDINSQSAAAQTNAQRAFAIAQPARDRAALQAKQIYESSVLPTMTAAAFSGAGTDQSLQELFLGRRDRDRNLANINDQNASADFSFDMTVQQNEQERKQLIANALMESQKASQTQYNSGLAAIMDWFS